MSHYFMANGWGKSRNSDRFYIFGLQNHCRGDCSHKNCLLLGRKAMTNLDSILKNKDITLQQRSVWSKLWFFQYGYESRTIKKAEHQIFGAFQLRCWRRLLRVPWTARRSNQSILKEISPKYSIEGLMLKL